MSHTSKYQTKPVLLGILTFVAGQGQTLKFDRAMTQLGGRLAHVKKISFTAKSCIPTLSSGSLTPAEAMKAINKLVIKDSVRTLYDGHFTSLRHFEMYENGRLSTPEPDALATTEEGTFTRVFDLAPRQMGNPDDFLQPLATFGTGSIYAGFEALTTIDANLTALTLIIEVHAHVAICDDLLIPPCIERVEHDIVKSIGIDAEALYLFVALLNSNSYDAITAADITELQITDESTMLEGADVRALRDNYYNDFNVGQLSQVMGEPKAATDDNAKLITGTAAAAPVAVIQPAIWCPPGTFLSKVSYSARPKLSFKWTGSQGTLWGLITRVIPRTTELYGKYLAAIRQFLPVDPTTWQLKPRTSSKRDYVGPRREYLPVKLKAPRAKAG